MSAKRAVHRRVPRRPESNRLETVRNWAVIVGVAVTVGVELFRASGWFDARLGELRTRIDEVQQALDGRIDGLSDRMSSMEGLLEGIRDSLSGGAEAD